MPPPGVQVLALTAALDKVGLKLDRDVTSVPVGFADQPAVLERGDVDAYMGTEPLCTQSVVSGRGVRINEVYGTPAGDINTAMWAAPKNLGDPDLLHRGGQDAARRGRVLHPRRRGQRPRRVAQAPGRAVRVHRGGLQGGARQRRAPSGASTQTRKAQFEGAADMMLAQGVITTKPKIDDLLLLDYQPTS